MSQTLNAQSGAAHRAARPAAAGSLPRAAAPRPNGRGGRRSRDRESRLQPDEPQAPRTRAAAAVTPRMDARGPGRDVRRHARSHVAHAGDDTQGGVRRERSRLVRRGPGGPRRTSRHDGRCEELRMAQTIPDRNGRCPLPSSTPNGFRTMNRTGTLLYSFRNPIRKGSDEMGLSERIDHADARRRRTSSGAIRLLQGHARLQRAPASRATGERAGGDRATGAASCCTSAPTGRGETTVRQLSSCDDLDGYVRDLRGRGLRFEEYDFPGLKTVNGIADRRRACETGWFKDQRWQHPRHLERVCRRSCARRPEPSARRAKRGGRPQGHPPLFAHPTPGRRARRAVRARARRRGRTRARSRRRASPSARRSATRPA